MNNTEFIKTDFNLPNQANELSKAEEVIEKLKNEITNSTDSITDLSHDRLYEQVIRVLDYVGHLSVPAFEINDRLEAMYIQQHPYAPGLAKELWLQHYETIHHPYNLLKNRCWRMLEELDENYIKKFGKNPPNWKI